MEKKSENVSVSTDKIQLKIAIKSVCQIKKINKYFIVIVFLMNFVFTEVGIWGDFSDWSTCSVTCGEGYKSRKRECFSSSDVKKQISTDHCVGKDVEIQPCDITTCPGTNELLLIGNKTFVYLSICFTFTVYGLWGSWSPCSTFCGIGVKQRNRSCIPPGSNCGNYTKEQRACGEANCQRVVG